MRTGQRIARFLIVLSFSAASVVVYIVYMQEATDVEAIRIPKMYFPLEEFNAKEEAIIKTKEPWMNNHVDFKNHLLDYFNDSRQEKFTLKQWEWYVNTFNEMPTRNQDPWMQSQNYSMAILLIVQKRVPYLQIALEKYRAAYEIEKILLVVSFDGLDKKIMEEINSIEFCEVKELIFPYNYQYMVRINDQLPRAIGRDESNRGSLKQHFVWSMVKTWNLNNGRKKFPFVMYMEDDYWISKDAIPTAIALNKLTGHVCGGLKYGHRFPPIEK